MKKSFYILIWTFVFVLFSVFTNTLFAATVDVTSISLSVTAPVAGATPVATATITAINPRVTYSGTATITSWQEFAPEGGTPTTLSTTFKAGYKYKPVFGSWDLWGDTYVVGDTTSLTINGTSVGTYGSWGGFGPIDFLSVTELNINVTVPKVGDKPSSTFSISTVPEEALREGLIIKWYEADSNNVTDFNFENPMSAESTFKAGKYYTYRFNELPLKDNYGLAETAVLKENGKVVDTYSVFYLYNDEYIVSFNANGGKGKMPDVTVEKGIYKLPSNKFTAPKGKTFKGWALTKDGEIIKQIEVEKDVTVYAIWKDENPKTSDPILLTCIALGTSVTGIYFSTKKFKK